MTPTETTPGYAPDREAYRARLRRIEPDAKVIEAKAAIERLVKS